MKKLLYLCLLVTVLALSACGETTTETLKEKAVSETEPKTEQTGNSNTENEKETIMYPQLSTEVATGEVLVTMNTSLGALKIKLFPEQAPKAAENFIALAENGYYDGVAFHRIIEDFMIQGGDPSGTGAGGESIYGEPFEDEFSNALFNLRGALSMANAGANTNGSQFFIVQASSVDAGYMETVEYPQEISDAYEEKGGTPWLDGAHTVFGQVIEGMEVIDQMAVVEIDADNKPLKEITIDSIEIIQS